MSRAELVSPPSGRISVPAGRRPRGRAFGIELEASVSLGLDERTPGDAGAGRRVAIELSEARVLDRGWRPRSAVNVLERRFPDGRLLMSVHHDPELGYRVYAPRVGRHLVVNDGRQVTSALPDIAPWRWQRLLFAQVLPLVATLQGLELLHASAVRLSQGTTLAFAAASGTGKSSVAAHLVASGASLLTDDVLALERGSRGVLAHPGVPVMSLAPMELLALTGERARRLGLQLGQADKILLATPIVDRPCRLDALYFLERSRTTSGLRIEPYDPDPIRLLAHSFNTYVRSQRRVVNQLAVYASVAEALDVYRVLIPPSRSAQEVAGLISTHAGERP